MSKKTIQELLDQLRAHPTTITAEAIDLLTAETKAAAKASKAAETAYFEDAERRRSSIQDRITVARKQAAEIDGEIGKLNQRIKDAAVKGSAEDLDNLTAKIDELAGKKDKILKSAKHLEGIDPGGSSELYESVNKAVGVFISAKKESDTALHQLAKIAEAKAEELKEVARVATNSTSMNFHAADQMKVSNHYHAELRQRGCKTTVEAQPSRETAIFAPSERPQQQSDEAAICSRRETTVFGGAQGERRATVINPWDRTKKAGDENDY